MTIPHALLTGTFTLLALLTGGPLTAQQITDVSPATATLGDVIQVTGTGLDSKTKLALVVDGQLVKKTKLKVVGSGPAPGEGDATTLDVEVRKGLAGSFALGVKQGKSLVGTSVDTLDLVPPTVLVVTPDSASPGDTVQVDVQRLGTGKHGARVAGVRAKITGEEDLGGGMTRLSVKVPKLPDGRWPLSVENGLGAGVLKQALEITGSTKSPGKASALITLADPDDPGAKLKPFKAKAKTIATDEQPGPETNVGAVAGGKKKPVVLGISLDSTIADLEPGDSFGPDDALLLYSRLDGPNLAETVWSSTANLEGETFSVDVVAVEDGQLVLFVCGTVRRALGNGGPERLELTGTITAPATPGDDPGGGGGDDCDASTTATGSSTGAFVSDPGKDQALFGLQPGQLRFATGTPDPVTGPPDQVLTWVVSFDPATSATPATFSTLNLDGSGLSQFTLQTAGGDFWNQTVAPQLPPSPTSMSVTIDSVDPVAANPFGILGCIKGSFNGTLTLQSDPGMPSQTFSGSFVIPWYDTGFGTR